MAVKTLFVGGPKDGKREIWPNHLGPYVNVYAHPAYPDSLTTFNRADAIIGMDIHTYRLEKFKDNNYIDFTVAFHSSIKNPMEALIKGYHYHRNPRYGRTRRIPRIPQTNRAW